MTKSDALSLISLVRERLRGTLESGSNLTRYETLLASAALDIAMRDLSQAETLDATVAKVLAKVSDAPPQRAIAIVSNEVREGKYDGDRSIFEALFEIAKINLQISNPKLLRRSKE